MLNRHEKFAIFNLTLGLIGILLFILIWQTMEIGKAYAGFTAFAFTGFGHIIFLRKKNSSEVISDERDNAIKLKSNSGGYCIALMYFIITSLVVYYTHSEAGVVPVDYFPISVWFGWAIYIFASSSITLVQYRRGTNCGTC